MSPYRASCLCEDPKLYSPTHAVLVAKSALRDYRMKSEQTPLNIGSVAYSSTLCFDPMEVHG